MLPKSTAGTLAGPTAPTGLVLERLPSGELAWLRPALDDANRVHQDLTRYSITQSGRDYLARERAMAALFGHPWPTAAESCTKAAAA